MRHIKRYEQLFENQQEITQDLGKTISSALMKDPDFSGYEIEPVEKGSYTFIVWKNPQEDKKWWPESGYGEYYTPGDDASMAVLAVRNQNGLLYVLDPEEKHYMLVSPENINKPFGNALHDLEDLFFDKNYRASFAKHGSLNYDKVKEAFIQSIWGDV